MNTIPTITIDSPVDTTAYSADDIYQREFFNVFNLLKGFSNDIDRRETFFCIADNDHSVASIIENVLELRQPLNPVSLFNHIYGCSLKLAHYTVENDDDLDEDFDVFQVSAGLAAQVYAELYYHYPDKNTRSSYIAIVSQFIYYGMVSFEGRHQALLDSVCCGRPQRQLARTALELYKDCEPLAGLYYIHRVLNDMYGNNSHTNHLLGYYYDLAVKGYTRTMAMPKRLVDSAPAVQSAVQSAKTVESVQWIVKEGTVRTDIKNTAPTVDDVKSAKQRKAEALRAYQEEQRRLRSK